MAELERLYSVAAVLERFGISRSTLKRKIDQGYFPNPRDVLGKQVWTEEDLRVAIEYADRWKPKPGMLKPYKEVEEKSDEEGSEDAI